MCVVRVCHVFATVCVVFASVRVCAPLLCWVLCMMFSTYNNEDLTQFVHIVMAASGYGCRLCLVLGASVYGICIHV